MEIQATYNFVPNVAVELCVVICLLYFLVDIASNSDNYSFTSLLLRGLAIVGFLLSRSWRSFLHSSVGMLSSVYSRNCN